MINLLLSRRYVIFISLLILVNSVVNVQELFQAPDDNTHTRWVSPENDLPELSQLDIRLKYMKEQVWEKLK